MNFDEEVIYDAVKAAGLDWHQGFPLGDEKNRYVLLWNAATTAERERCAALVDALKPHGGRMWTDEQAACFDALSHASEHIQKGTVA